MGCFCGEFACIGFNYRFGMLELLCFKHYQERVNQCHTEKKHMEVKSADRQRKLL